MCLILTPLVPGALARINDAWLADFTEYNQDGYGFFWVEDGRVQTCKAVKPDGFSADYRRLQHLNPSVHLRMRTHSDVSEVNCHPMRVLDNLYVMHNGIISHADTRFKHLNDTWHYIIDTLKPVLKDNFELLQVPAFQAMLAGHIGNSRLVFLDALGRTTIINREQGLEHNGVWYSNTYAWSAHDKQLDKPAKKQAKTWDYPYYQGGGLYKGYAKSPAKAVAGKQSRWWQGYREDYYGEDDGWDAAAQSLEPEPEPEMTAFASRLEGSGADALLGMSYEEIAEFGDADPWWLADVVRDLCDAYLELRQSAGVSDLS